MKKTIALIYYIGLLCLFNCGNVFALSSYECAFTSFHDLPNYGGIEWNTSLDGSGKCVLSGFSWNDRISSIKMPATVKVKVCSHYRNGIGNGICRMYFGKNISDLSKMNPNASNDNFHTYYNLGTAGPGGLNNSISYVEISDFNPNDFSMIIASDPQIGLNSSAEDENFVGAINSIKNREGGRFAGIIINGDLTNTAENNQRAIYRKLFMEDYSFTLYPGLGNHDISNHFTDANWSTKYGIVAGGRAVHVINSDIFDSVASIDTKTDFDWKSYNYTTGFFPPIVNYVHVGSLLYSWEIGDYHFIQLNNSPGDARSLDTMSSHFSLHSIDIKQSYMALLNDLWATDSSKKIIINVHDFKSGGHEDYYQSFADDPMVAQILAISGKGNNILAIFAGHIHQFAGMRNYIDCTVSQNCTNSTVLGQEYRSYTFNTNMVPPFTTKTVPVFYAGSGHLQPFSKFLQVDFKSDHMIVNVLSVDDDGVPEDIDMRDCDISLTAARPNDYIPLDGDPERSFSTNCFWETNTRLSDRNATIGITGTYRVDH